jgi:sodium transport system permease protein
MRWRAVSSIFAKEVIETVRDRRTLFAMIVLPVLLQPVLMMSFGGLVASEQAARQKVVPTIAVWGPLPELAVKQLKETEKAEITETRHEAPANAEEAARETILAGKADLVIAVPSDAAAAFAGDGSVSVQFFYDSVSDRSANAANHVEQAFDDATMAALKLRLARYNLPEHFEKPLRYRTHDLASKERRGGDFAGRILPMLLLLMVMLGAVYPAIDMTAGEKERGTLQTLMCAPVEPLEILAGKYLTVVLVALTSAIVNVAAMGFAISRQLVALDPGTIQFSLGPRIFLALFAALIPAALLMSAVLLGMSVFARSFREAQTYVTPTIMALVLPGFVASLPSVKLDGTLALVPVVNLALLLRDLLKGEASGTTYLVVTAISLAYAAVALLFAGRVFESEQVLLGGEKPWRDVFGRRDQVRATPTPGAAVLFIAVLLVIVYYGSIWADPARLGMVKGVLAIQLGLLLAPALLAARLSGYQFVPTFSLRLPTRRAWLGTMFLALGGWSLGVCITAIEAAIFPGASDYFAQLTKSLSGGTGDIPVVAAVLLLALLPAMAEEFCFRGFVMSGLANTGSRWIAITGSAIGFGLLHLSPYHVLPAAVLGLVLGFATLESGTILAGGLVHFVNNGLAVASERAPALKSGIESNVVIALGVASSIIGLVLLRGSRAAPVVETVALEPVAVPHVNESRPA